jgi:hypothetical protein
MRVYQLVGVQKGSIDVFGSGPSRGDGDADEVAQEELDERVRAGPTLS